MKFGSLIDYKFFNLKSCERFLAPLMKRNLRKQFGILEAPTHISNEYNGVVSYKIFVCGRTATGKTSMILKLLGKQHTETPAETIGIETSVIYWPVTIIETKKIILFKISFWDAGESNLNAYSHILPSCMEDVDCVLYLFSMKNKTSWEAIPPLITKINVGEKTLEMCVGTQLDNNTPPEISRKMIQDFEDAWKFPVLTINNIGSRSCKFKDSIEAFSDVAPFMNRLCELLWYNDQVKAGLVQKSLVDYCFVDDRKDSEFEFVTKEDVDKHTLITFC